MTKISNKWLVRLLLAVTLAVTAPNPTWAAETSGGEAVVAQEAPIFMEKHGATSSQIDMLQTGKDGTSVIPCGEGACNLETQNCLKYCRTYRTEPDTGISLGCNSYAYKCMNKDYTPRTDESLCFSDCSFKELTITGAKNYSITFGGSDGKKYAVTPAGNNPLVTYNEKGKNTKGCEVLPVKLYNSRSCFFCPLFGVVYKAAEKMTEMSFSKLAPSFAAIMALGMAIWIAFQTLTHVSSLTKQDAPKFIGNLIKQSFKFVIAFIFLTFTVQIYDYIVLPLLEAGLTFGRNMLFITSTVVETSQISEAATSMAENVYYKQELYIALEDFITAVQREISFMQAIGTSLLCIGAHMMMGLGGDLDFGAGFMMAVEGLLLAGFGFLLSLAFAFYLVDAVVQLGIVGALMPFLIATWPFKLTSSYSNKGFSMLLNSFFVFVFMGLVISLNLQLVDAALNQTGVEDTQEAEDRAALAKVCSSNEINPATGKLWKYDESCKLLKDPKEIRSGSLEKIAQAINGQDDVKLKELTDITGMAFLILVFCCIFGFKLTGQVSSLADKMASGGMKGIAPSIATMGASWATSGAKKVTQPVRRAAVDKLKDGGKALWRGAKGLPGRAYSRLTRGKNQAAKDEKPNTPPPGNTPGANTPTGGGNPTPTSAQAQNAGKNNKGAPTIGQNSGQGGKKAPVIGQGGTGENNKGRIGQGGGAEGADGKEEAFREEFANSKLGQELGMGSAAQKEDGTAPEATAANSAGGAIGNAESQTSGQAPEANAEALKKAEQKKPEAANNEQVQKAAASAFVRERKRGRSKTEAEQIARSKANKTKNYLKKVQKNSPGAESGQKKLKVPSGGSGSNHNKLAEKHRKNRKK